MQLVSTDPKSKCLKMIGLINQILNKIIMKKSIFNLVGVQELSKNEQKNIAGGKQFKGQIECIAAVIQCTAERAYDPCGATTSTNYPC